MDKFGLIAAALTFVGSMQNIQRRTGRTSSTLARANNGDVVVVMSAKEGAHVLHMIKERELDVEVVLFPHTSHDFTLLHEVRRNGRRVLFDHTVIEYLTRDYLTSLSKFVTDMEALPPVQVPEKPPSRFDFK